MRRTGVSASNPFFTLLGTNPSKAALIHMAKQHAVEFGNRGVRVNVVAPGPVETEMAKLVHSVGIRSDYHDAIPLNRYGTVEEMAQIVAARLTLPIRNGVELVGFQVDQAQVLHG